ncbi:hypothetical protein ABB37_03683 [Leptomonas pyrrhocoris]|uniref:Uncharacterized protein n=1 Tax=Leptomonas pyrrhocoris TaxID=157538 RepID=A0A0N0DW41_LEPPY|nr:hypothetical protein ABB37_03683 [Leptomonas pyrrhocoris]KPA81272.1 hypothetical protein ABB37_03683 [Leptomonas pyrrhocoris]|eukprot:XP_015659711.1 hypothetical protein ABB37_03683 [Leptomonas pyrrhocoris]
MRQARIRVLHLEGRNLLALRVHDRLVVRATLHPDLFREVEHLRHGGAPLRRCPALGQLRRLEYLPVQGRHIRREKRILQCFHQSSPLKLSGGRQLPEHSPVMVHDAVCGQRHEEEVEELQRALLQGACFCGPKVLAHQHPRGRKAPIARELRIRLHKKTQLLLVVLARDRLPKLARAALCRLPGVEISLSLRLQNLLEGGSGLFHRLRKLEALQDRLRGGLLLRLQLRGGEGGEASFLRLVDDPVGLANRLLHPLPEVSIGDHRSRDGRAWNGHLVWRGTWCEKRERKKLSNFLNFDGCGMLLAGRANASAITIHKRRDREDQKRSRRSSKKSSHK